MVLLCVQEFMVWSSAEIPKRVPLRGKEKGADLAPPFPYLLPCYSISKCHAPSFKDTY